jgi:hypothetical protein
MVTFSINLPFFYFINININANININKNINNNINNDINTTVNNTVSNNVNINVSINFEVGLLNRKYDWEKAEKFFIDSGFESRISLKDISQQLNIPYQTVRRYAAAHEWHNRRYRAWVEEKHGMSFEDHLKALHEEVMNRG